MQKHDTPGTNRSGSTLNPSLIQTQLAFAESVAATPVQGSENIKTVRMQYIAHADVVGSPAPLLNQDSALGKALSERGLEAQIFADKLGQRLAFERSGVRLYEALMDKVLATEFAGKPELTADIGHICQEETEHFLMLKNIMEYLAPIPLRSRRQPMSVAWRPRAFCRLSPIRVQRCRSAWRRCYRWN